MGTAYCTMSILREGRDEMGLCTCRAMPHALHREMIADMYTFNT